MAQRKTFNGHSSWNAWNVALWINNDEGLYFRARRLAKFYGIGTGAEKLADELEGEKTPDGAPYTKTTVREALRGILS